MGSYELILPAFSVFPFPNSAQARELYLPVFSSMQASCGPGWPPTSYLKLILLPMLLNVWDYRCVLPCPASAVLLLWSQGSDWLASLTILGSYILLPVGLLDRPERSLGPRLQTNSHCHDEDRPFFLSHSLEARWLLLFLPLWMKVFSSWFQVAT